MPALCDHGLSLSAVRCLRWVLPQLVFDTWNRPWTLLFPSVIEAIFVQHGANERDRESGREYHVTFAEHFGLALSEIPLVVYNPLERVEPFSLLAGMC